LRRGEEQRVDAALRWHRIPIEGDHGETMPWKRERYVLGRTGIEQPKQRALAFTYADRLAVSEHPVVERSRCVEHLEAVVRRRSLADVLHAHPPRLPVMGGKQDLLVVTAGIIRRLDDEKTKKARIETEREIRPGRVVAVVPPRPGWLRGECVALRRAVLHDRGSFLHGAVGGGWDVEAMPMDDIVDVGVVADVDGDLLTFAQAQFRARDGAIIGEGIDELGGRELQTQGCDPQRMIWRASDLRIGSTQSRAHGHAGGAGSDQQLPPAHV